MRNFILTLCTTVALVGCAATISTVTTDLATAQQTAQAAVATYPIIKGIALVAELANPALAPVINTAIALADPKVVQAQTLLTAGSADVATLTTLATVINQQVQALTVVAAPAIKAVPSTTP